MNENLKDFYISGFGSSEDYDPTILEEYDELQLLKNQIKMILKTKRGTIINSPYFGLFLDEYLFDYSPNINYIQKEIKNQISTFCLYDHNKFSVNVKVDIKESELSKTLVIYIYINNELIDFYIPIF